MPTLMEKTFLIKAQNFKEIADGKGALEYLLLDEQGEERSVIATAELGYFNKLKSIKAIYHREKPLVKALSKATVNQSIRVDFTQFNAKNPRLNRLELEKSKTHQVHSVNQGAIVIDSEITDILLDSSRLFQLLIIALLIFTAILLIRSII